MLLLLGHCEVVHCLRVSVQGHVGRELIMQLIVVREMCVHGWLEEIHCEN